MEPIKDSVEIKQPSFIGSCRFTLMILCNLGVFQMMILRFNLSMAIVCMTEKEPQSSINPNETDSIEDNFSLNTRNDSSNIFQTKTGEFNWSKEVKGVILSAFFYGYICTQLIGGTISDKWGGKLGMLLGIGVLSLGSILSPVMARLDPMALVAVRAIQGLFSGLAFPSTYNLFNKWSSPEERATIMSIVFAGIPVAIIVNYPLSSALCESGVDGGWPLVFYIPGAVGLLWCVVFQIFGHSSPEKHPRISPEEKNYLLLSCNKQSNDRIGKKVPWKKILLSRKVHALWITHMCSAWGYYLLAISLPTFLEEVLNLTVINNGFSSSLPYIGMLLFATSGKLFDFLRSYQLTSLTNLRKMFNSIGFVAPAICLYLLYFLSDEGVSGYLILFTTSMAIHELAICGGFYFSHSDIAGPFAGSVFGITNTMAQIPGFVNPLLVAYLTPNKEREEWLSVFYIAASIYMFGCLVYIFFGSAELEPWAKENPKTKENSLIT